MCFPILFCVGCTVPLAALPSKCSLMARWDWEKIKYENPGLFCVSFSNWNAVSQRGKKKWSSGAQGTLLCWRQRGKTYEGMTEILFHFISLLLRLKDKRAFWNALVWNAELFIFSSADSIKKKNLLKKCRRAVLQLWSQQQWCVWAEALLLFHQPFLPCLCGL